MTRLQQLLALLNVVLALAIASCGPKTEPVTAADALVLVDAGIRQACEALAVAVALRSPGVEAQRIIETTCHVEERTRRLRELLLQNQLDLARAAGVVVPAALNAAELAAAPPDVGDRPGDAGAPH